MEMLEEEEEEEEEDDEEAEDKLSTREKRTGNITK